MRVGDGRTTSFWGDAWCEHSPLKDRFPDIYEICIEQNVTVAEAAALNSRFSFKRWMAPDVAMQIHGLTQIMSQTNLSVEPNKPFWKWAKGGKFSVNSVYKPLRGCGLDRTFKHLRKIKIPLKIKIWLWLIWHDAVVTKDNLLKRNWRGNSACRFCNGDESISHLFFNCPAAKFIWSVVGQVIGAPTRHDSFWWFPQFIPTSRNT
jgi:hypothetical protein